MFLFFVLKHCSRVYTKSSAWGYLYGIMVIVQKIVSCTVLNESLLSGEFLLFRVVHVFNQNGQRGLVADTML